MENKLDLKERIAGLIDEAIRTLAQEKSVSIEQTLDIVLERPKREGQGDWATNVAMRYAKLFSLKPLEFAELIVARLGSGGDVSSVEVAPPGFINFTLSNNWIRDTLAEALSLGDNFGRNDDGRGRRVQVEFVSANPTGPIHLGHGRGAAVGDVMSSILSFCGWAVEREYYINDAGLQMENLGKSTQSRYFTLLGRSEQAPFPEDGYPGDYIDDIARKIIDEQGDSLLQKPLADTLAYFRDTTCEEVLKMIKSDLSDFGVLFDVWFSEKSLYDGDIVPRTIEQLKSRNYAYEEDGAVWFRSTSFGDDKDRVMIRANGIPTYFTSDIAYLQNKYDRGFERLIYVWGADHHGYVPRMRSVNEALGARDENLEFLLIQFVSLLRNGEPVSMSKRAGTFITLREVIDEVGSDATRFSFVNRKSDSHLEFDLEVAKRNSADNPVYYVQYAHARICSILREAESRGVKLPSVDAVDAAIYDSPAEIKLAKMISRFPEEVLKAAQNYEPHRIAFYTTDIAEAFHAFYNNHKVLGEERNITEARLVLIDAARTAIANALKLLGVKSPERM